MTAAPARRKLVMLQGYVSTRPSHKGKGAPTTETLVRRTRATPAARVCLLHWKAQRVTTETFARARTHATTRFARDRAATMDSPRPWTTVRPVGASTSR